MIRVAGHVAGMPVEEVAAQLLPLALALAVTARVTGRRLLRSLRMRPRPRAADMPIRKEP